MVRYPEDERRSLGDFERMRVRLPDGTDVPLARVADAEMGRGFSTIRRVDRQRVINVTADVDIDVANANEILGTVTAEILPPILASHPRVSWSLEGEQKEQRDSNQGLLRGFLLALIAIYAMMAIPFRSYVHPAVVMTAVPFGLVGAIWGHMLMGEPLSRLSFIGMVALTGVVVNDSLVMVDFVNRHAVHRAGQLSRVGGSACAGRASAAIWTEHGRDRGPPGFLKRLDRARRPLSGVSGAVSFPGSAPPAFSH